MVPISTLPDRRDRQLLAVTLVVRVSTPAWHRDRQYADHGGRGDKPECHELLPFTVLMRQIRRIMRQIRRIATPLALCRQTPMTLVLRTPDVRLRPLLRRELVAVDDRAAEPITWLAAPRAIVSLIIDLEGEVRSDGERMPGAWVGALGGTPTDVTVSGTYAGVDIKLTPLGAYRLLAMPVSELGENGAMPIGEAFGRAGEELAARLHDAATLEDRLDRVEAFLLGRASEGPEPAPFVEWAWDRIAQSRGRTTVTALAAEIGCSRRHLQAKFSQQAGLSPKTAIRMTRFEHVCAALAVTPGRWADLAAEAGYADQAHLNRDFRELAGITPSEYVTRAIAQAHAHAHI
jgi:AraC-like DNA-binding protein